MISRRFDSRFTPSRLWSMELTALVGLGLMVVGNEHQADFWDGPGAALILSGVILLAVACAAPKRGLSAAPYATAGLLLVLLLYGSLRPFRAQGLTFRLLILSAAGIFLACSLDPRLARWRLWLTAAPLVITHIWIIVSQPAPSHIDVYYFLTHSADRLIHLQNPYLPLDVPPGMPVPPLGARLRLTYPPGILVVLAPFRLLGLDIRWAYVVAAAAAVGMLARFRGQHTSSSSIGVDALILLPLGQTRINEWLYYFSNTEWVMLGLVALVLALLHARRSIWVGVVLGLGSVTKQYFLVFPGIFLSAVFRTRPLMIAALVAVALCASFVLWNSHEFVQGVAIPPPPLAVDRVSFGAAAYRLTRHDLSTVFSLVGIIAAFTLWWVGRVRNRSLFAAGAGMAIITACSPYSGYNYYFYASGLVAWGLVGLLFPVSLIPGERDQGDDRSLQP